MSIQEILKCSKGTVMELQYRLSTHILAIALSVISILAASIPTAFAQSTFATIKARGFLLCGTAGRLNTPRDYNQPGTITGFNRDFCRAIAAATLKNASKVKYIHLVPRTRFAALQQGAVDVLLRSTTWTLTRDMTLGIHFAAITFYDGQGFIAHKSLGIKRLSDLISQNKRATVCVETNTTTEINLDNLIREKNLPLKVMKFHSFEEARYAFFTGRCQIFSGDRSFLAEFGTSSDTLQPNSTYTILEDIVSKEPLSIAVRNGDARWFGIVRWVVFATIEAEELGITSKNADFLRQNGTLDQKYFLGSTPGVGKPMGLDDAWAYRIVKAVGNYGEIFNRNLGPNTPYKLKRGLNRLWENGGLMYSPPFR